MAKENQIQRTKSAPPPPELPIYGRVDPTKITFIGRTNYVAALEEKKFVFGLKREDRKNHVYIVGKSGVGKSKLIELMIRQDIANNFDACLFDPVGDIIKSLLNFIPENRKKDVLLIDPTNINNQICFNPLLNVPKDSRYQLAQNLSEIMALQFGENWNPSIDHLLRFALLALLDSPKANLYDIITILTEKEFRQQIIGHISDNQVKKFWEKDFQNWSEKFDSDAVNPLLNKLNQLLLNPYLQKIFTYTDNKTDITEFLGQKKITLINLAKNKLGETSANFLGGIILSKIKEVNAEKFLQEKNELYLYIDEFTGLVTSSFENILSESRKLGISFTLAHQYLNQLSPSKQALILGNIGTLIVFRVTGEDALKLKSEMAPIFDVKDMINLGTRQFYAKIMIDGEVYDPFSAETLKIINLPDNPQAPYLK